MQYLTTNEVAEKAGVGRVTVGNWIRRGLLPADRVGWQYLIQPKDFDAFLANYRICYRTMQIQPETQENGVLTK